MEMKNLLTTNFKLSEFVESATARQLNITNDPPEMAKDLLVEMCENLLEPIRAKFCKAIFITSGYRSPELNEAVHGAKNSQHIWTSDHVACDFQVQDVSFDEVFDWIRLESGLPFDQLIREHGSKGGGDCIHISYTRNPRRIAMLGATHNASPYTKVKVVNPIAITDPDMAT